MPPRQAPATGAPSSSGGRDAQRRRTRRAIVEATQRLLVEGGPPPTVDAIAEAADVSRRTVYMHFPTLDQLLLDAALGALSEVYVDTALERADAGTADAGEDVHARVAALVKATLDLAPTAMPLGRQIIRLTVDGEQHERTARRGARRTGWIEAALQPVRDRLTDEQLERLVSGLAMVIGWEAFLVLQDVRGLPPEAEARTVTWAAQALLDSMLAEAGVAASGPRVRAPG
jgi:AcrR family transcriptional regulator